MVIRVEPQPISGTVVIVASDGPFGEWRSKAFPDGCRAWRVWWACRGGPVRVTPVGRRGWWRRINSRLSARPR